MVNITCPKFTEVGLIKIIKKTCPKCNGAGLIKMNSIKCPCKIFCYKCENKAGFVVRPYELCLECFGEGRK